MILTRRLGGVIGSTPVGPSTKLLFVFGSLESGAQLRTLEVCEGLQQRHALEFDFCSIGLGPNETGQDVELLGGSTRLVTIRCCFPFRFARLLRDEGYDVINTEPQLLSGLIVWLAARLRVPVRIVTIHNSIGDPGQTASPGSSDDPVSPSLRVGDAFADHASRDASSPFREALSTACSPVVGSPPVPAAWSTTAPIPLRFSSRPGQETFAESSDGRRTVGSS